MSTAGDKYKNLKVKELQELLQKNGIPHTGKKEELIDRLVKHDEQAAQDLANLEEEFGDLSEFDDSKLALDDEDKQLGLDDITDPIHSIEEEVEETKTKREQTTEPVVKPNSNFKFTPITFDKKPSVVESSSAKVEQQKKREEQPNKLPIATSTNTSTSISTKINHDAEKALERAKRFGIQLNETAKKDIRAQRFGISSSDKKQSVSPKSAAATAAGATAPKGGIDPEVLKKRAERFGLSEIAAKNTTTKKSVKGSIVPVVVNSADEEKKRKRAERFGNADALKKQKN